jgi:hypothetical protein
MKMFRVVLFVVVLLGISAAPRQLNAQGPSGASGASTTPSSQDASSKHAAPGTISSYTKPTEGRKFHNYLFDSFGPYAIAEAAIGGAITQGRNSPPEWGQGWDAYGQRVGSTFGISLVTTTTRYALAEVFREDSIYYRCDCSGIFPRLGHALISTITARRGEDGHRVFSFPSLAAPYAGSMTAVLGWYPSRYEPMDGFRLGNFNLATEAGKNVLLEFVYGGPHTMLGKMRHKN